MKTSTKKLLVFVLSLMLVLSMGVTVLAIDGDTVIGAMENQDASSDMSELTTLGGKILSIIQIAGIIIGAIILAVLGLKYMTGSLEEKAEYKKTMIPYIVGAVILIAAPTLAKGIFNLIQSLGTTK